MIPLARLVFPLILALVLVRCSTGPNVAGSGSESPNAINGTVYAPLNGVSSALSPAADAQAVLFEIFPTSVDSPVDFTWHALDTVKTDAYGCFAFQDMKEGTYSILFEKGVFKAFSGYFVYFLSDSILTLSVSMDHAQNIRGTLKDTSAAERGRFSLGLIGTPYFDTIPSGTDSFSFHNIPKGIYSWNIESVTDIRTFILTTYQTVYAVDSFVMAPQTPYSGAPLFFCWSPDNDTLYTPWATETVNVRTVQDTVTFQQGNYLVNYIVETNP